MEYIKMFIYTFMILMIGFVSKIAFSKHRELKELQKQIAEEEQSAAAEQQILQQTATEDARDAALERERLQLEHLKQVVEQRRKDQTENND